MQAVAKTRQVYYGWVVVWTLALTEMTSWGILYYTFSVMLAPTQAATGWARTDLSGAFSLSRLVAGFASIPIGRLLDRYGTRPIMTVGSCLAVLLVVAWSQAQSLAAFYLVWVGIGIITATVLYEPAFAAVATWFTRRRAQALTILTFGGGLASVVYVPLAAWLLREQGWRGALLVLAVLLGIGTIPFHALLLRRRPADLGLAPDGQVVAGTRVQPPEPNITLRSLLRMPTFWWLSLAFVAEGFATSAMVFHLVPLLTDAGYSTVFAASALGLVGVTALPGRLIFTPLGARINRKWIAAALFGMMTLSFPVLLLARSEAGIITFVLVFGAGYGALSPARAGLTADLFGVERYGMVGGVLAFLVSLASAAAPIAISLVHDGLGGYTPALVILFALSAVATLFTIKL